MSHLEDPHKQFDLSGTVAVVTGAYGTLGKAAALALAGAGVKLGLLGRRAEALATLAEEVRARGAEALALEADVLERKQLEAARAKLLAQWGRVDHLLNYAGGNRPDATASPERSFFELPREALIAATNLNLAGTILPCQVFGQTMAERKAGSILNISSLAAIRPLTRVVAYSAAKAAVSNFTQWLAVHMAQEYSPKIRVNALAPGFFLTEQNRFLLTDKESGAWTPRGKRIIEHTPAGRFGEPGDLAGAVLLLLSPAGRFITGTVLTVDGGFSAFSGV